MLMKIGEDLVPLAVLGLGGGMLVLITIFHGFGLDLIVVRYKRKAAKLRKKIGRLVSLSWFLPERFFSCSFFTYPKFASGGWFCAAGTLFRIFTTRSISALTHTQLWAWGP